MNGLQQKVGSIGLFLQSIYFLVLVLFAAVILPSQGFAATANAYHDPAIALPFAAKSPLRGLDDLRDLLLGIGIVLTALAFYEHWHSHSPGLTRLMIISASIGTVLFLASGIAGFVTIPELARLYTQGRADAGPAYLAVTLITGGLRYTGFFAYGWWVLLISWIALRNRELPKLLNYIGILVGIAGICCIAIPLTAWIVLVLGFVWSIWLGIVLLALPSQAG